MKQKIHNYLLHCILSLVVVIVLGFSLQSRVFASSEGFAQTNYITRGAGNASSCTGFRIWVYDWFTDDLVDPARIQSIKVEIFRRDWNSAGSGLTPVETLYGGGDRFLRDIYCTGTMNANDMTLRVTVTPTPPYNSNRYQIMYFDSPIVRPSVSANTIQNVQVYLWSDTVGYTGGVNLNLRPGGGAGEIPDWQAFTTNIYPTRYFNAWSPREGGVEPHFGSYFDGGMRLITGPGGDDYLRASPEVYTPGTSTPRYSAGYAAGENPRSLGPTRMYKINSNFTDPYPVDGRYKWNATMGIGNTINTNMRMAALDSSKAFMLLTDIRPTNIAINGSISAGLYTPGLPMNFTATVQNFSAGIAANTNTPVTFSLTNTATGTVVWTGSSTIGQYIDPSRTQNATSGNWTTVAGSYRIDVCANNPYTRLTVQGSPVCTSSTFSVGVPPPPPPANYEISGQVFYDKNSNGIKDPGEVEYPGPIKIAISAGGAVVDDTLPLKNFRITNITNTAVSHIVTLKTNPATGGVALLPGFSPTFPTGAQPSYSVKVGSCTGNISNNVTPSQANMQAQCSAGNITQLYFGITDFTPWTQYSGFDVRDDRGLDNKTPESITSSCSDPRKSGVGLLLTSGYTTVSGATLPQTSGLLFSSPIPSYGSPFGDISQYNWTIKSTGTESYKAPKLTFSYDQIPEFFAKTNESQKTFTCSSNLNDICPLPTTSGVWKFDGDPTLMYNLSGGTIAADQKVFVLIDGKVTFKGDITVANGGIFVIASTGEMHVDKDVGYTSSAGYSCAKAANLQGIYSTYTNFVVDGTPNVCSSTEKDRMLVIDGTVITNADLTNGSSETGYSNERNLCDSNPQFPAVVMRQRPDFILNMPNFIKNQKVTFKEVAP